jgi:hypothetical protein
MHEKKEFERIKYTAYFICYERDTTSFILNDVLDMLSTAGNGISNSSRAKQYLKLSKDFRNLTKDEYIMSAKLKVELDKECNFLNNKEIIETDGALLDENLFCGHRGYLTKLIKQANHCYENNCFDACAVMIRRAFEILIIFSYQNNGIENEIKDKDGNYYMLEVICNNAKNNKTLDLSRSKSDLDSIRELGNYAAHKITYNTTHKDIENLKVKIRVCFEELLYKSGLKK